MTCEICGGSGAHLFIDVWEMRRRHKTKSDKDKPLPLKPDVPCPECKSEDFWGYIDAMKERLGEPFSDGVANTAALWQHPDGRTMTVLKTEAGDVP